MTGVRAGRLRAGRRRTCRRCCAAALPAGRRAAAAGAPRRPATWTGRRTTGPAALSRPGGACASRPVPGSGVAAVARRGPVVVPALAVDRHGRRLGRGGGSYDRALARVPAAHADRGAAARRRAGRGAAGRAARPPGRARSSPPPTGCVRLTAARVRRTVSRPTRPLDEPGCDDAPLALEYVECQLAEPDPEENVPTYQYACTACGHQLEAVQSFSDEPLTECPACEGRLRKVFNSVGIVFKGSGFYRTDSRASGSETSAGGTAAKPAKSESSSGRSARRARRPARPSGSRPPRGRRPRRARPRGSSGGKAPAAAPRPIVLTVGPVTAGRTSINSGFRNRPIRSSR